MSSIKASAREIRKQSDFATGTRSGWTMRYYFHLESETNIHIDHLGQEFAQYRDAMDHALGMARRLAEEDRWLGWSLRVIDAQNTEVLCVPILDSIVSR